MRPIIKKLIGSKDVNDWKIAIELLEDEDLPNTYFATEIKYPFLYFVYKNDMYYITNGYLIRSFHSRKKIKDMVYFYERTNEYHEL